MSSCNKTLKQVLSIFFQIWLEVYLYFGQHFTLIWNLKNSFWISKNVAWTFFKSSKLNIYIYIKYHIKALHFFKYSKLNIYIKKTLNIFLVSSAAIFSTAIEYGTSSSSIDSNELLNWIFSHSLRDSLDGTRNPIGCSCNR